MAEIFQSTDFEAVKGLMQKLEYNAVHKVTLPSYDEPLIRFQFEYLVKNHNWLSHEQARPMLE